LPGVTVTADGVNGGDAVGLIVVVGRLGGVDVGAYVWDPVSRCRATVGISTLDVWVAVGVWFWIDVGQMAGVAMSVGVFVAMGVAVSVGFGARMLVGAVVVAVSVGFGARVLVGMIVFVGDAIGCVAAQDTLPRAQAPSGQVVWISTRAIAPLKVFVNSPKFSDPVVPSM
jgi:hypothetical protein